jgi:ABC-type transporter Mla maintaining outer membrane lipid asymmetry permease subunit MlaE
MNNVLGKPIEWVGATVLEVTPSLGRFTIYMIHVFLWFIRPPLRVKLFFEQMVFMGNKSLFIVILTSSFSGMGVSSIQYLGVPRVFATVVTMPMLAAIFMLIANTGSWVVGTQLLGIDEAMYFAKISDFMNIQMIIEGLIKAAVFGYMIAIIGTYQGFHVKGGAEGVGKGTNQAVVWGMVTVLVMDFFLTAILAKLL